MNHAGLMYYLIYNFSLRVNAVKNSVMLMSRILLPETFNKNMLQRYICHLNFKTIFLKLGCYYPAFYNCKFAAAIIL